MTLIQALENLVDSKELRGNPLRSHLRPGLPRLEIETALVPLGLNIPIELFELYQWHDGVDEEYAGAPLFGEHNFFPLEKAVRVYHRIVQYYADPSALIDVSRCFPIVGYSGSYYSIYCDDNPFEKLIHPIISIFQGIGIEFENLEKMILTAIEWSKNGIYDSYPVDEKLMHDIKRHLNPRVPYRSTTL